MTVKQNNRLMVQIDLFQSMLYSLSAVVLIANHLVKHFIEQSVNADDSTLSMVPIINPSDRIGISPIINGYQLFNTDRDFSDDHCNIIEPTIGNTSSIAMFLNNVSQWNFVFIRDSDDVYHEREFQRAITTPISSPTKPRPVYIVQGVYKLLQICGYRQVYNKHHGRFTVPSCEAIG